MRRNKENIVTFLKKPKVWVSIAILFITLISSRELLRKDLGLGHDLIYHLTRIKGIVTGIKNGDILVLLHHNINGYANGLFYPQIFLYFPAILNICGINLIVSYKIFIIICNLATTLVMYKCIKSMTGKRVVGIIAAALYTTCNYRMLCLIVRAAIGEVQAFIFIPVVILGLYEVFYRDSKKWYILVIGMTGLIYTHLISVVLAVVALCLPILLINIKKIFIKDKSRLKVLINAVILTVLLTVAFWLPFLEQIVGYEFYLNNKTVKTNVAKSVKGITENIFIIEVKKMDDEFVPGVGLIIVIFSFAYLFLKKRKDKEQYDAFYKILLIISVLLVGLMSVKGVWKYLTFLNSIQFAWRFQIINSAIFCIISATTFYLLAIRKEEFLFGIVCIVIVCISIVPIMITDVNKIKYSEDFNQFWYKVGAAEYLPYTINIENVYKFAYKTNEKNIKLQMDNENTKTILKYTNNQKGNAYIELPLYYYKGYEIVETTNDQDYISCEGGYVRVNITSEEGTVVIKYKYTLIQEISLVITVLTYCLILFRLYDIKRRKKVEE